jgi:hypothetical protein
MSKLDLKTAWQHVKALWPDALEMRRVVTEIGDRIVIDRSCDGRKWESMYGANIDWGSLTQWPPKEEWRDAVMPEDWGKKARFCDYPDDERAWFYDKIAGLLNQDEECPWVCSDGTVWRYCQVRVTAQDKTPPDAK